MTVQAREELAEHIGHNDPKIISDQNLGILSRQLALHANVKILPFQYLKSVIHNYVFIKSIFFSWLLWYLRLYKKDTVPTLLTGSNDYVISNDWGTKFCRSQRVTIRIVPPMNCRQGQTKEFTWMTLQNIQVNFHLKSM